jgi:hypothetical protein
MRGTPIEKSMRNINDNYDMTDESESLISKKQGGASIALLEIISEAEDENCY